MISTAVRNVVTAEMNASPSTRARSRSGTASASVAHSGDARSPPIDELQPPLAEHLALRLPVRFAVGHVRREMLE